MPPKVISGGDNPYDIHDAKLSSSATAHESSSVTAHEISNTDSPCKIRLSGIRLAEDTEIISSFNEVQGSELFSYASRKILTFIRIDTFRHFLRRSI